MRLCLLVLLLVPALCHAAEPVRCPEGPSHLVIDKGEYTSRPGVVFGLQGFSGYQVPRGKQMPLCLAKITDIQHGRVFVSGQSLTNMFTQKMKQSPKKQSVSDIKVRINGDRVVITGKVKKLLPVSFEIEGPVEAAEGYAIRLRAEKIKAAKLPVKGLLEMVGAELSSLINSQATRGVTVQENTILFEPEKLANIRGQLTRVQISGDALVIHFAPAQKRPSAARRGF
jgi:hypothetical protein